MNQDFIFLLYKDIVIIIILMPGKWHTKMENLFPEDMQEVKFYCSSKSFNTCRRADIYLSDTRTCEIQH